VNQNRTAARGRRGRREFLQGGVGVMAGSTAAFLLACGGDDKKEEAKATTTGGTQGTPAAAASTQTPKRGGRLLEAWYTSTNNLNPTTNYTEGIILSGVKVYDRLISSRLGKDTAKEYVLEAAQSVEQPDQTTIIFKLKPGLKYQDRAPVSGRAVSADDIVKDEHYRRDNPAVGNYFQNVSMQSVEAPDAQTVVYKLKAPNAYAFSSSQLAALGECIVPKELLDNLDTAWPVGSGPYQLTEYGLNTRYLYKRFDGYREASKGLPYIDEREVRILVDPASQEAAFRSEQLHVWRVPIPTIADTLKKDLSGKIEMFEFLSTAIVTLSLNATKPPFNDARVREAIYRILNRQQYVELLEGGKGKVTPGPLPVPLTEYQLEASQTDKYFKQDARAAKQLLDAAGFPYDKELDMSTLTTPRNNQGMEIFQQQASQVGIKVRLTPLPFADWIQQRVATGNWDAWYAGHPANDSPQPVLRLQHSKTYTQHVYNGLKDPAVDAMIDKSEQTLDRNERVKQVKDIQLALLDKYSPFILTHDYNDIWAHWKYIRNYELMVATQAMYLTEMWLDK
jgi:peptide/nickel transport system substrate-binding protein